jgi:hypothetical protein
MSKSLFLILVLLLHLVLSHFPLAFAQEFRYDSHGARDPFSPPSRGGSEIVKTRKEVQLEGSVFDPLEGSVAIVNGQMIREGDLVDGFRLVKLEENKASFEREGEIFEVVLNKDNELIREYLVDNN